MGLALTDGVVTLTGQVATFSEKKDALRAVLRALGVGVVADEAAVQDRDRVHRSPRVHRLNTDEL